MSTLKVFQDVKAIYFDLDDTLCGYWDAAKRGLRQAIEDVPVPGFSSEEFLKAWAENFRRFAHELKTSHWYEIYLTQGAITRVQLINETLHTLGIEDAELAWRIGDAYGQARNNLLALFPEARKVLSVLHNKYPLGLITNGPADVQRQEIETLNIEEFFDVILIEGEVGVGKPHPKVMHLAEEKMNCSKGEILFVGNSFAHDMMPAIELGWKTAWIRRPSDVAPSSKTGRPEDKPEGTPDPDITIASLEELLLALNLTFVTHES